MLLVSANVITVLVASSMSRFCQKDRFVEHLHLVAPVRLAADVEEELTVLQPRLRERARQRRAERDELKALNDEFHFLVVGRWVAIDEPQVDADVFVAGLWNGSGVGESPTADNIGRLRAAASSCRAGLW